MPEIIRSQFDLFIPLLTTTIQLVDGWDWSQNFHIGRRSGTTYRAELFEFGSDSLVNEKFHFPQTWASVSQHQKKEGNLFNLSSSLTRGECTQRMLTISRRWKDHLKSSVELIIAFKEKSRKKYDLDCMKCMNGSSGFEYGSFWNLWMNEIHWLRIHVNTRQCVHSIASAMMVIIIIIKNCIPLVFCKSAR